MTTDIPRGALPGTESLTVLGTGGEGSVYALPPSVVPQQVTAVAGGRQVVYKEFRTPDSPAQATHHREVVGVFRKFGTEQQQWILDRAAWPLATVTDGNTVVGILMPVIPEKFYREFPASGGRTRRGEASFQMLLNDDRYLQKMNLRMSEKQIYSILLEVCDLLRVLQDGGIVVGDLSARNLMFSVPTGSSGTAAVYLIDCDSVSTSASVNPDSVETPGWDVPSGERRQTKETDRYKFGLLVLRLLSGHQVTRDPGRLPAGVPSGIRDLVVRTLTAVPTERPSFGTWWEMLQQVAGSADSTVPAARPATVPVTVQAPVAAPTVGMVAPVTRRKPSSSPVTVSRTAAPRPSAAVPPQTAAAQISVVPATTVKPDIPVAAKVVRVAATVLALASLYMLIHDFVSVGNYYDWNPSLWRGYLGQLVSWYEIPVLIFSIIAASPGKLDRLWRPLSLRSLSLIMAVMQALHISLGGWVSLSNIEYFSFIEFYLRYDGYSGFWGISYHLFDQLRVVFLLIIAVAAFRLRYDKDGELVR